MPGRMLLATRTTLSLLLARALLAFVEGPRHAADLSAAAFAEDRSVSDLWESLEQEREAALEIAHSRSTAEKAAEQDCSLASSDEAYLQQQNVIQAENWAWNGTEDAGLSELLSQQTLPPSRRQSAKEGCQASIGPRDDPNFVNHVRPCGEFSTRCTDIPLVKANLDYPGGGAAGAVIPGQDYVVQFDIGIHPAVVRDILKHHFKEMESCIHCPPLEQIYNETCLETIVTGGAMWGDLGLRSLHSRAYDCMGSCGRGCSNIISHLPDDIGALDCLKHDLCSAWKSVHKGQPTVGFCFDPDCGDEAAMSLFNCWKGWRLFGSLGGHRHGPFSVPAICDERDPAIAGCWNHGGWFTTGRCQVFQGWKKGQGIPDPHPLRSPIQRLR
mmetsp:Transcript_60989/g.145329  ORF Transcript_60989/g.145329 Transcript_60989/m.145329 type:complete len:384 (+) Transcript_60989:86-1237(+)